MPNELHDRMTVPEAAAYVRRSASFLNKRRVYGGGPAYIKLGASVLYERSALDAWLAASVRRSTSEYGRRAPDATTALRVAYGL